MLASIAEGRGDFCKATGALIIVLETIREVLRAIKGGLEDVYGVRRLLTEI